MPEGPLEILIGSRVRRGSYPECLILTGSIMHAAIARASEASPL